jgi:DNA-directed RNA polymerase sigma subunit (sigma70/sigma32)
VHMIETINKMNRISRQILQETAQAAASFALREAEKLLRRRRLIGTART